MSMKYIRKYYNVPVKRGCRIQFINDTAKFIQGFLYQPKIGTVLSTKGNYLRVRFDGDNYITILHPTHNITYIKG